MEQAIYILCGLTALACAVFLLRGYVRKQVRLLLWCSLFFFALTVENAILFVDIVVVPLTDLSLVRNSVALIGVMMLMYGLASDTK